MFRRYKHVPTILASSHKEAEILRADDLIGHLNDLISEAERLKRKAEKDKDYRTALLGVREQRRLIDLRLRVAIAEQQRAFPNLDFDGQPVEQLTDLEILQILARDQGLTEAKFLRIAHDENTSIVTSIES